MPNRQAHRNVPPPAGYGSRRAKKEPELEAKKIGGRSVKKLVRSLSDRYAAVTSPLTCKKKTSCNSRTPSLKTMKTTAATSLLPLKPALSISCRPVMQPASKKDSPSLPLKPALSVSCNPIMQPASKNGSFSSTVVASHTQSAPSISISKRLLHMHPLARTGTIASLLSTHADRRAHSKEGKLTMKTPSALASSFQLPNARDVDKTLSSTMKKGTEMMLYRELLMESREPLPTQTGHALEVLSSEYSKRTKLEWQQLEAFLNHKDDELESLQTAGLMLKELCMKQDDEMKSLKAAFPATLRELAELREACQKQEKELAYSRVALPALQAQVTSLSEQLRSLTQELTQIKAFKETSSLERVSSHFHDREASNSCSSCLSREPSPATNGFLEHLRYSRNRQNIQSPCEDQGPMPVRVCETASSCCSSVTSMERTSETPVNAKHRKGYSAVLSIEHMLKGSGKRSGRRLATDKDIVDTLQELNTAADREQSLLQARCADAVKELRSSSSRFSSLEPIKFMLTCASPQLHEDSPEKEKLELIQLPKVNMWNLKPT